MFENMAKIAKPKCSKLWAAHAKFRQGIQSCKTARNIEYRFILHQIDIKHSFSMRKKLPEWRAHDIAKKATALNMAFNYLTVLKSDFRFK